MSTLRFQPMMESRPIREIAYEVLKHAIVTGEIPAGERIVETDYAERLHISRTPLREALRKLERDGLVYSQRTSGRFVTEDETMIQQAKRGLAERHIKTFVAAMVRLGFRREEMIALLRQETGEENDHGSFDL